MCGLLGNFKVEDLPVGPRWFCTEKHFAQYTGLPVKESGYYGLDRIEYEDSGDEPEYGWEDDEYEAESKKRKRGFRKCSKCGDRGHNAPKCENPQYYEALARKEEMLDHVDYAIKEFTKDAKEYSLNRRYDMAKMRREDATDMRKLKRMIENNHFGKAWHFAFGLDSEPREYAPNALWDIWDAESFSADFKGHNVCVECKSDEIPLSSTDGGEQGLMDYYFNCSNCNFGWFVAVRDETNADEPNTVNVSYEGFLDMDAESLEEYGLTTEDFYCRNCATTELKHFAYVKDFNLCIDCSEGRIAMGAESFEGEGCTAYRRGADPRYECTCKRCSFGPCEGCSEGYAEVNYTQRMELETKSLCSHCLEIHEDEYGPNLNLQPNVEDAWMYEAESFEASSKWAGFCPKCKKWRTKEMSRRPHEFNLEKKDYHLAGKLLCGKFVQRGGEGVKVHGIQHYTGQADKICGTPLTKGKNAESFKGEGTLEPCPHDAGIDSEEVSWLGEGDRVVHITGRCRDCSAEGEGYVQIEFEDGERWKDDEWSAEEKKLPPVEKAD